MCAWKSVKLYGGAIELYTYILSLGILAPSIYPNEQRIIHVPQSLQCVDAAIFLPLPLVLLLLLLLRLQATALFFALQTLLLFSARIVSRSRFSFSLSSLLHFSFVSLYRQRLIPHKCVYMFLVRVAKIK